MAATYTDFVTDSQIVQFFQRINSEFVLADMPTFVRSFTYEEIKGRTDITPTLPAALTLYVDGRGDKTIVCPRIPIATLTGVRVINKDTTYTDLIIDQTNTNRQIWYDADTGHIELVQPITGVEVTGGDTDNDYGIFPQGIQNIRITGTFGTDEIQNTLAMLQLYLMLRQMSRLDPETYGKADIISERIGKYSYTLGGGKGGTDAGRMTLDELIEHLFGLVDGPFHMESV